MRKLSLKTSPPSAEVAGVAARLKTLAKFTGCLSLEGKRLITVNLLSEFEYDSKPDQA